MGRFFCAWRTFALDFLQNKTVELGQSLGRGEHVPMDVIGIVGFLVFVFMFVWIGERYGLLHLVPARPPAS